MKRLLFITSICLGAALSCTKFGSDGPSAMRPDGSYRFEISCEDPEGTAPTKSSFSSASLSRVSNVNIFIYRGGTLVSDLYFPSASGIDVTFPVASDTYDVYMLANVGDITAPMAEDGLSSIKYTFNNYGGFESTGFPMANSFMNFKPGSSVSFKLKRLIGMYSITMENSSDVVDYRIKSLQLKNCARDIYPFGNHTAGTILESGDYLSSTDISTLNSGGTVGIYFLENLQGILLPGNTDPRQKVPDNLTDRTAASRCTYIQILADVTTATAHFDNVYYRVYLGQDMTSDFNIKRSTHYYLNLNFSTNLIADEGWRIEPEDPDVIGAINLSKTEATVIKGITDCIYVTTKSANGKPVDFNITLDSAEASAAGLSFIRSQTTYHGKSATEILFSTSKNIDGLNSYNESPDNNCQKVHFTITSKDTYNGLPTIQKTGVVKVYHQAFPIYFKAKQEGDYWYLYAYSNNPLKLGLRFDYKTYSGQNATVVKSGWNRFQKYGINNNFFDDDADWGMEDNTIDRNGRKIGSLGKTSDYSGGMRLDITVTPITDGNFSTPYSNECFLENPKFSSTSMYMGSGTKAYYGPGSNLSPGNTAGYSSDTTYDFSVEGSPTPTSYSGFTSLWTTTNGIMFYISSSTTGWNRQNSYSLSSFAGSPFYFVNGGLTLYSRNFRYEDPKYLNDSARIGLEVSGYEPGRDLGMISSSGCKFGALIGTMTQFLGQNHTWQSWKSYDYNIYMTINGCSSWPGASYSSSGYSPGMYVEEIEWD